MKLKIFLLLVLLVGTGAFADSPSFSWKTTGESVALMNGDKTVWRFYYGADKDKPFFHPLALVDGTELTDESNKNHPWHHALWFSWKKINGVNFWEENKKTGKAVGKNAWSNVDVTTHPNSSAVITMDLAYTLPDQSHPVLREKRIMKVSAPDTSGTYCIDWESVFTAVEEVVLDRTPLPGEPGGKAYGGYAGLSVRFKGTATEVQAHTEKGKAAEWTQGRFRGSAWVMDYSALIDGKPAGIAIFDHPENLNAPTMWYAIDTKMKYFSPAVICNQPHKLTAGESMTLNYRICIHEGRWTTGIIQDLFRREY